MTNRRLVLSTTMLVSAFASLAQAGGVLYSAPVGKHAGEGVRCVALNVGTQARNLKADVIEVFSNTTLDSEQALTDPGGIVSASGDGLDGTYCRFTTDGSKRDLRASAMVFEILSGATLSVVSVP
jgi:hypothetical protein